MYEVAVTQSFGDSESVSKWAWELYDLPNEERPHLQVDTRYFSPSVSRYHFIEVFQTPRIFFLNHGIPNSQLYNVTDITEEDMMPPPCSSVSNNDQQTLLGVRVKLHSLQGKKELNGRVGRCGVWLKKHERYQVFLRDDNGSVISISVKPNNLEIADPVTDEELDGTTSLWNKFPTIAISMILPCVDGGKLARPIIEDILDPVVSPKEVNIFTDIYYGPISRSAQVILRTLPSGPMATDSSGLKFVYMPSKDNTGTFTKGFQLYSNFVKQLALEDSIRVQAFESNIASIKDSTIESVCGKWFKITVELDGLTPRLFRELLVSPEVSMRELHEMILCPGKIDSRPFVVNVVYQHLTYTLFIPSTGMDVKLSLLRFPNHEY